jgi:hypothetical protein
MYELKGQAVGEVKSGDGPESFTFTAFGQFPIDGSELRCSIEGDWKENGSDVRGEFLMSSIKDQFSASFSGVKDSCTEPSAIDAEYEKIFAEGRMDDVPDSGTLRILYTNNHLEFRFLS